jgi:hypothetical protein
MMTPLCGGTSTTLVASAFTSAGAGQGDIAIDSAKVYWTNNDCVAGTCTSEILDAAKSGGVPAKLPSGSGLFVIDSSNVYYEGSGNGADVLLEAPLSGGPPISLATIGNANGGGFGSFEVNSTDAFLNFQYPSTLTGGIVKVPLGGGTQVTLASVHLMYPGALAVDSANVYFVNDKTGMEAVMKLSVSGGVPATIASGQSLLQNTMSNIIVDSTSVYWTNGSAPAAVMSLPLGGGTPTTIWSDPGATIADAPRALAVDATSVYWTAKQCGADGGCQGVVMSSQK